MQRTENGGIVISCDFCGTDWDQVKPMIEGHKGSVLCLECLSLAFEQAAPAPPPESSPAPEDGEFSCKLCLREKLSASMPRWSNPTPPQPPLAKGGGQPVICRDCIDQGATAFDKDEDVPWRIPL